MDSLLLFSILLTTYLSPLSALNVEDARIQVDGSRLVAKTDDNYICATMDWWPPQKCNYHMCPWGHASILNLDLAHPILGKAIKAFKTLRIRLGGSLQDQVIYDTGNLKKPCTGFNKTKDGLFGFTTGCLPMDRWDKVHNLLSDSGVIMTFGLNALFGRHRVKKSTLWEGDWDPSNTIDFIKYTISKGQKIDSWEFGNELAGPGIEARVEAEPYGKDMIKLKHIINDLYKKIDQKPLVLAPGGFYDKKWFDQLLDVSGSKVVDALTHHIYNLGPGDEPNLVGRILDPNHLSKISDTFKNLKESIETHGSWSSAWVGECGGAFNSGGRNVSNSFVNSFWYLDQLGMAASYDTKVYCRQTLIGGNYGLLDTNTFVPNPDYYSALLWHQLMSKKVLSVDTKSSPHLRSYAHCARGGKGITLLLINLGNQTEYSINVDKTIDNTVLRKGSSFIRNLKRAVSWVGIETSAGTFYREEYHLTPENGNIKSRIMLLNGEPLRLTDSGDIPVMKPVFHDVFAQMVVPPLSIKFVVFPNFDAPVCR